MAISWTRHRFSGGALALDAANTVVHRGDPARSFDRFERAEELPRFAAAATGYRAAELGARKLSVADIRSALPKVLAIREATDRLFRNAVRRGAVATADMPELLGACAGALAGHDEHLRLPGQPFGDPATPLQLEAALAVSALSLLSPDSVRRLRICPNCNWLFVDRSRNASRLWCDMAVCGNRQKAKRHYRRRKAEEVPHA
ncbi:CGNR zinc finger domain-containing protein [Pseudaminobacter salicylatoxidans]|uniref:CGNR zinc finger domain-containing protein n=1 Tax=Pseudaminobacter salicylatoxidans TaxID=93369 RepID=UPI000300DDE6|nr:CGNR zinc finger domain-containing protein [Pseudaminobacter salicylatoxidans]